MRPEASEGGDSALRGGRTCVLPVKLERGTAYGIGINSPDHKGFVSAADERVAAEPYNLRFATAP